MWKDYIKITIENLVHRQMRSWLTVIGIVIGIAAIVSLITVAQGMQNAVEDQFQKLGISNVRLIPGGLQGPPAPGISMPKGIDEKIEKNKYVDYINIGLYQNSFVTYANEEQYTRIIGYDTDLVGKGFFDLDIDIEQGRFLKKGEKYSVMIGAKIANDLYEKEVRQKNSIYIKDQKFKVIGIFEEIGSEVDDQIIMPLETMRDIFEKPDEINGIIVNIKTGVDIDEAAESIEKELLRTYEEDEFQIFTPEQLLSQIQSILSVIEIIVGGIAAISLLVGGIGISNSMFTSVLERTREIGVMKAIGARNNNILTIFLIEAGTIGLIGGTVGTIIGAGIAYSVGTIADIAGFSYLVIRLKPEIAIFGLIFSFIIGVIAGLIPAYRASKLNPVDALRYE